MTSKVQVRSVPKLMLATALALGSASVSAGTVANKQINWLMVDSASNRLVLELADVGQGCGNATVKQQFWIDPVTSANYNAVVGAAMAAFTSGKKVQVGYGACINTYAYKITDFSICGATCPP
jgi:hypothetical protein